MPTFGKIGVGISEMGTGINSKVATRFQAPESGILTDITSWNKNVNTNGPVNLFVYADNAGAPGVLLGWAATPNFDAIGIYQWISVSGLNIPIVGGTYYWLGVQSRGVEQIGLKYDAGIANQMAGKYDETPPDDPFGTPTYYDREQTIYATYTPSAPPGVAGGGAQAFFRDPFIVELEAEIIEKAAKTALVYIIKVIIDAWNEYD